MEIYLLILFAAIALVLVFMMIRTYYWQNQFESKLNLSKEKNQAVLIKQGGFLSLTLVLMALTINNSFLQNPLDQKGNAFLSDEAVRSRLESYFQERDTDSQTQAKFDNVSLIQTLDLSEPLPPAVYSVYEIDGEWYLISEDQMIIVKFESAP